MTKEKRCYGWPVGQACANKPGTKWGPNWCQSCDEKRLAHISAQLKKIGDALGVR